MGESILKRLLGGMGRKQEEAATLDNRLRLVTGHGGPAAPTPVTPLSTITADSPLPPVQTADTLEFVIPLPVAPVVEPDKDMLVDIKGFVMSQHAAQEIEGIAKGASDCVDFARSPADEVGYRLTVTLLMKPDPRQIDEAVEAMQAICSQLGGKAEGFALRQQQMAA